MPKRNLKINIKDKGKLSQPTQNDPTYATFRNKLRLLNMVPRQSLFYIYFNFIHFFSNSRKNSKILKEQNFYIFFSIVKGNLYNFTGYSHWSYFHFKRNLTGNTLLRRNFKH